MNGSGRDPGVGGVDDAFNGRIGGRDTCCAAAARAAEDARLELAIRRVKTRAQVEEAGRRMCK